MTHGQGGGRIVIMVLRSPDPSDDWPRGVPRPPSHAELWQEDEPLESDRHVSQVALLRECAQYHFRERPDVFVGGNMPVYYSSLQVRNRDFRAPDFFAVLGARLGPREFWVVWEEEQAPDVVIEVLSDSTEQTDRGRKKQIYQNVLKVFEYYLFDFDNARIEGFRLDSERGYQPIAPGPEGRVSSLRLGLELGVMHGVINKRESAWLRFFHPDGTLVMTGAERAEVEALKADALRAKLAEYEAKFGKL